MTSPAQNRIGCGLPTSPRTARVRARSTARLCSTLFSRRVVGWSIDSSQTANLVVNALGMAIENRQDEGVVIHSDHGTQYTSWAFTRRALDSGLMQSMGSIGDCYDNGQMESFWARMQVELLNRKRWNTRLELANAIFEYLEIFHNRQRRHSSLGMLRGSADRCQCWAPSVSVVDESCGHEHGGGEADGGVAVDHVAVG